VNEILTQCNTVTIYCTADNSSEGITSPSFADPPIQAPESLLTQMIQALNSTPITVRSVLVPAPSAYLSLLLPSTKLMSAYPIEINSTDESTFRAADDSPADTHYEAQEAKQSTQTVCVFVVRGRLLF
jgi:hypothetical protein